MTADSSIVAEVRERAMGISARFGHDLRRYVEDLQRRQRDPRIRCRLVSQLTVVRPDDAAAIDPRNAKV